MGLLIALASMGKIALVAAICVVVVLALAFRAEDVPTLMGEAIEDEFRDRAGNRPTWIVSFPSDERSAVRAGRLESRIRLAGENRGHTTAARGPRSEAVGIEDDDGQFVLNH